MIFIVFKDFLITDKAGIHMRPVGMFVSEMKKISSTVTVRFKGKEVNGKGILSVMAAGIPCGAHITVACDGADEQAALRAAAAVIERCKF